MLLVKKFFRNSVFLSGATLLDQVAKFLLILYLARFLSIDDMAIYFLVISILLIFQSIANFGLVQMVTREVARDPSQVTTWLPYLGLIGLGIGTLVTLLSLLFIRLAGYPEAITSGLYIVTLSLLPGTLRAVAEATFNAIENTKHITWVTGVTGILRSVISLVVVIAGAGLGTVFAVIVGSQFLAILIYAVLLFQLYGWPQEAINLSRLVALARPTLTFALMSIFLVGTHNLTSVFLSAFGSLRDIAVYGVAFKIVQVLIILRPIVMRALSPSLVQQAHNPTQLHISITQILRVLTILVGFVSATMFFMAPFLIPLLYDETYLNAVPLLQVLAWLLISSYLYDAIHWFLLSTDHEKATLRISLVSMVINVVSNILLITWFGALGAALALLVATLVALILTYRAFNKHVFVLSFSTVFSRSLLSLVVATLVSLPVMSMPILATILFSCLYIVLLFATKVVTLTELQHLMVLSQRSLSKFSGATKL